MTSLTEENGVLWAPVGPADWPVLYFEEIDSSNTAAKRFAEAGLIPEKGCWLVAGKQTQGKGRLNRQWDTKSGNFAGTLILPGSLFEQQLTYLPLAVGLAVRNTLSAYGPNAEQLELKWPNDVLLNRGKIAGILIEQVHVSSTSYMIIGIGVNLCDAPEIALYKAVSLSTAGFSPPSVQTFLNSLSMNLHSYCRYFENNMAKNLVEQWRSCAFGLGEEHWVTIGAEKQRATLIDMNDDASLSVKRKNGECITLYAGDIS